MERRNENDSSTSTEPQQIKKEEKVIYNSTKDVYILSRK